MAKSLFSRGFFFKSLLCLILFLYLNFVQIKFVFAYTTLDRCAADPVCAKTIIIQSGSKEILKKSASSVTTNTLKKTSVNLTTGATATTTIQSYGTKGFLFGVGAKLADLVFGNLVNDGIDAIQDKIYQSFCNNYPDKCEAGRYIIYPVDAEGNSVHDAGYKPFEWTGKQTLTFSVRQLTYGQYSVSYYNNGNLVGSGRARRFPAGIIYVKIGDASSNWDSLSDEDKNSAIDDYLDNNYTDLFNDLIDTTPVNLPDYSSGNELYIDGDLNINGNLDVGDGGYKHIADEEPPPEEEQPPPEEEEVTEEDCIDCKELTYTSQNFFVYTQQKFITEPKFPFDIFGDIPFSSSSNECPTVTMFSRSKELCFINDSIGMAKYPVWIAWMFRLVFSL